MTSITIQTKPNRYNDKGHFESPAVIVYGNAQYKVAGWDATGVGRIVDGGPMVAGPYVFSMESDACVDANGRGAREYAAKVAAGQIVHVRGGEILEIAGIKYQVESGKRYFNLVEMPAA